MRERPSISAGWGLSLIHIFLIGAMAKKLDLPKEVWTDTIKETVPSKFIDMNLKAFELGYNADV